MVLPVLALLAAKVFVGPVLGLLALWIRLSAKEIGVRRNLAVFGMAFPAIVMLIGMVVVGPLLNRDAPALLYLMLVEAILSVASATVAAMVPSGLGWSIKPGFPALVRRMDGAFFPGTIVNVEKSQALVELGPGVRHWVPRAALSRPPTFQLSRNQIS